MILNIYKEKNWTSFDVVAKIRGILGKKAKVGHAGTLDPLAEGVLLVLTGSDTKKQDKLTKEDKEYVCEIAFGAESETYDLEGELKYKKLPKKFDLSEKLPEHLNKYLGEFGQTVPPYSAVKVAGKRLYKTARKEKIDEKDLPTKKVTIKKIDVLEYKNFGELPAVKLKVICSKGTYIRSLAHDLGKDLKTGAVLVDLVRTRVGDYEVEDSVKISELDLH